MTWGDLNACTEYFVVFFCSGRRVEDGRTRRPSVHIRTDWTPEAGLISVQISSSSSCPSIRPQHKTFSASHTHSRLSRVRSPGSSRSEERGLRFHVQHQCHSHARLFSYISERRNVEASSVGTSAGLVRAALQHFEFNPSSSAAPGETTAAVPEEEFCSEFSRKPGGNKSPPKLQL